MVHGFDACLVPDRCETDSDSRRSRRSSIRVYVRVMKLLNYGKKGYFGAALANTCSIPMSSMKGVENCFRNETTPR
jgi:hypothetical protein